MPAFVGFEVKNLDLFPILFVTIACGAVSGFHSLVSSGTSSKMVANEKDMRLVATAPCALKSFSHRGADHRLRRGEQRRTSGGHAFPDVLRVRRRIPHRYLRCADRHCCLHPYDVRFCFGFDIC